MLRGFKYRIYPTDDQKKLIEQTFNCCRMVYNMALGIKIDAYKNHEIKLSAIDLCYQLAEMKKDYAWVQEVDSQALQASVKKIDIAFKNFYNGGGYPKFKAKKNEQSFQCPNNARHIDFEKGLLSIPKLKNIPIQVSRKFVGQIKTVTIRRVSSGKYFATILVDTGVAAPDKKPITETGTLGIDLGIKDFAILSTGEKFGNPRHLKNSLVRLKVMQRRASRKKKGSANRKKANKKTAIIHERISNQRGDFLHKLSSKIVNENQVDTVCVESLAVRNMVKNHCLAQAISDVGWAEFVRQLRYKCEQTGKNLIEIGRFEPSSKTCSACGAINETLTLADREWTCASCFATHDRDVNAAKNIKFMGLKTGRGTPGEPRRLRRTKKQEKMYI